jgi:hypothetical protein
MKPIIKTIYTDDVSCYINELNKLNVEFEVTDVLSGFWGKQFTIKNTKSNKKFKQICEVFER